MSQKLYTVELEALCRGGVRVWADDEKEAAERARTNPPEMFRAHSVSTVKVHGVAEVSAKAFEALEQFGALPEQDE